METGRRNDYEKELVQGLRRIQIDRRIARDDSAERGNRIGTQCFAYCQSDVRALRDAGWHGMFYDSCTYESLTFAAEFGAERSAREKPQRRIQIQQIVVRKRLS